MTAQRVLILSPRSVNFRHGTGVQVSYLESYFPEEFVSYNFGDREYGVPDTSRLIESTLASAWPLENRGRRFWKRLCESSKISFWNDDRLSARGKRFVSKELGAVPFDRTLAIIDSEQSASRFNSIQSCVGRPYSVILYDLVHCDVSNSGPFAELRTCIEGARHVFAISKPLEEVASHFGARSVSLIGFFRPPVTAASDNESHKNSQPIRILVLGNAAPGPLDEIADALSDVAAGQPKRSIEVHYVGAPFQSSRLRESDAISLVDHGICSAEDRDEIGMQCDFAILAGPANDPGDCPFARYSIPSKIGDFASFGLPFIARVSEGSATERFVRTETSDFAVFAGSKQQLAESIRWLVEHPDGRIQMGESARSFADKSVILPEAAGRFRSELAA